jgi:hypothetical protein
MRWLNLIIALFLGGITAGALALHYHYSVLLAVPTGAVAGGLMFNPREVYAALKQAITEVIKFDYPKGFHDFGQSAVNIIGFVGGIVGVLGVMYLYGHLFDRQDHLFGMAVAFMTTTGSGVILAHLPSKRNSGDVYVSNLPDTGFEGLDFCLRAIVAFALMAPWLLVTMVGVGIPKAFRMVITSAPAIFFRFVELVSTHDRLVVMASVATGSLIGIRLGNVIFCGVAALAIGLTATFTAKAVVRSRHAMAT